MHSAYLYMEVTHGAPIRGNSTDSPYVGWFKLEGWQFTDNYRTKKLGGLFCVVRNDEAVATLHQAFQRSEMVLAWLDELNDKGNAVRVRKIELRQAVIYDIIPMPLNFAFSLLSDEITVNYGVVPPQHATLAPQHVPTYNLQAAKIRQAGR